MKLEVVILKSAKADLHDLRGYITKITKQFGRDAWLESYGSAD